MFGRRLFVTVGSGRCPHSGQSINFVWPKALRPNDVVDWRSWGVAPGYGEPGLLPIRFGPRQRSFTLSSSPSTFDSSPFGDDDPFELSISAANEQAAVGGVNVEGIGPTVDGWNLLSNFHRVGINQTDVGRRWP